MDLKDKPEMVTRMMAMLEQLEHAEGTEDVESRQKIEQLQQILADLQKKKTEKETPHPPPPPEGQPTVAVVEQEIDSINQRLHTLQSKVDNLDPMTRQLLVENAEDWIVSLQKDGRDCDDG